jgi:hypothetical protein
VGQDLAEEDLVTQGEEEAVGEFIQINSPIALAQASLPEGDSVATSNKALAEVSKGSVDLVGVRDSVDLREEVKDWVVLEEEVGVKDLVVVDTILDLGLVVVEGVGDFLVTTCTKESGAFREVLVKGASVKVVLVQVASEGALHTLLLEVSTAIPNSDTILNIKEEEDKQTEILGLVMPKLNLPLLFQYK